MLKHSIIASITAIAAYTVIIENRPEGSGNDYSFSGFSYTLTDTTPRNDTLKTIQVLRGLRSGGVERGDSVRLRTIAGNVLLFHGGTYFECDSAVINQTANHVEAFGNIHINSSDSVHVYSQYLRYHLDTRIAYLQRNVKLTDGKGTLTTNNLEYDVTLKIGRYNNGGTVVNQKSVLTSNKGIYYADLKDVYFVNNVTLKDPQYRLTTDSLLYNTGSETARFIAPTVITDSSNRKIETTDGFYDLKNGKAEFGANPVIQDGAVTITGNRVAIDDSTGISQVEGNGVMIDTAQGITVIANRMFSNRNNGSFLATQKPVLIIKQDTDSIYISADTLFSGRLSSLPAIEPDSSSLINDSSVLANDNSALIADSLSIVADSTALVIDSLRKKNDENSLVLNMLSGGRSKADSTGKDSTNADSDRYFEAYRNVRIFSDSLQAVCDSLFYGGKDSVFRMFRDPVAWNGNSQISGDTIYLYTKNKKADRLQVFYNAIAVNKMDSELFNQIRGNTINAYFVDGNMDYMRAKGDAESVYYAVDEDSAYVGVNKTSSDAIDIRFENKEVSKIVLINSPTAEMIPIKQANPEALKLRNFRWLDFRRPKTKFEIFE